jgi:glycerol-3-phosphate dehydrogenase subunit C
MSDGLPIRIMKPDRQYAQRQAACTLLDSHLPEAHHLQPLTPDSLKTQLKQIRRHARDNIDALITDLQATLGRNYPELQVHFADCAADAVTTISTLADGERTVKTNNSSVVTQELKPGLERSGFSVENAYLKEYSLEESIFQDYWDLPKLAGRDLYPHFSITQRFSGLPKGEINRCLAVLGVNAMSSEDGTTFFMEHTNNIGHTIRNASHVVLVIGLDKIVSTSEEAQIQTQAMGVFGFESILLGIGQRRNTTPASDDRPSQFNGRERELHVILLDNGRRDLLASQYRDIFLCVGCRACNKHCPIRHAFVVADSHCDLPYLLWQAAIDQSTEHGTSFTRKLLGKPDWLAKIGTRTAPMSNWMMGTGFVRAPMEVVSGIDRRANLPKFHSRILKKRLRDRRGSSTGRDMHGNASSSLQENVEAETATHVAEHRSPEDALQIDDARILEKKVAYFHGCFANYYDPEVGEATLDVLHRNQVEVAVPEQACCGLPMVGKGNERQGNELMAANNKALAEWVSEGYTVISSCASCAFFLKNQYPKMLSSASAQQVSDNILHVTNYLLRLHRLGGLATDFVTMNETLFYHTPCHLRALQLEQHADTYAVDLLQLIPGVAVTEGSEECCGMAGSYGLQKAHYPLSQDIAVRLIGRIKQSAANRIVDDCGACGLQIEAGTGRPADHPMIMLHEAYGLGPL